MHWIDILIFLVYLLMVLGIGIFFHYKNKNQEEYFIGDKKIKSWHIGLSVVATDVGGGFSIGLGGLGFVMGISGSWMLFTGLIGAWLSSVLLIPTIFRQFNLSKVYTFPQVLKHVFGSRVAFLAGLISFIGYLGFTASQLLAGAKLAKGTFPQIELHHALIVMGIVAVVYTSFGGIKAVIYTDTVQWIILMLGLIGVGIPLAYIKLGGYQEIVQYLPNEFLSLGNITVSQIINWMVTIVPIWFVGMTLYQRIFASKSEKEAQKAWFIAGLLEYPIMAFMGVILGLFARAAAESGMFEGIAMGGAASLDAELGLPMLLSHILPIGFLGLMLSAYFSAIMSTADSCLLAASGNLISDLFKMNPNHPKGMRYAQWSTFLIGAVAIGIAASLQSVLELMLLSYAFMVAGMLIPVLVIVFKIKANENAAFYSMLIGGGSTVALYLFNIQLPYQLDPIVLGLICSAALYSFLLKTSS